ncbi:MAG: hypothetical protein HQP61_07915 [Peptococcaceae bacterium]|nr:hypothetical protein [Candidatus Syntrophopropionicum ammoniitolerans]
MGGLPGETRHRYGTAPLDPAGKDKVRDKQVSNADGSRWNSALTGIQVDGETVLENPGGAVKPGGRKKCQPGPG